MGKFIRMLFGDDKILRYPKALADAAKCIERKRHPLDTVSYVYGTPNQHFLIYLGQQPILAGDSGVMSWGATCDRNPSGTRNTIGHINWGISCWRHKLEVIRRAVVEYGEVIYLDWDCWQSNPMPADFWERYQAGQPIQAAMLRFRRPIMPDREMPEAAYKVHGGLIYCRDVKIMDELIQMSIKEPLHHDEVLIALWIEKYWGTKWKIEDVNRWINEGWEPFGYGCRNQVRKPLNPIFWEGRNQ